MCVACGQELCKQCKGCHNSECERYTEPTEECEIDATQELVEHPLMAVQLHSADLLGESLSVREHLKKAPLEQGCIFASGEPRQVRFCEQGVLLLMPLA